MAAAQEAAVPAPGRAEPSHGLRIFLIWLPLALAADLLIWFVLGPHLPPGAMSSSAAGQQFDIRVMSVMAAPVFLFVVIFAAYAMITWRARDGDEEDGPPIEGNTRAQFSWIAISSAIVLSLFIFGTVELVTTGPPAPTARAPARARARSGRPAGSRCRYR